MQHYRFRCLVSLGILLFDGWIGFDAEGGGSGLNTIVIVNQMSSNSCELGNYYCERRQVPPQNVLPIAWPGGNVSWTNGDFQTSLLTPLLAMLSARRLTNQIDYVVLSMDIPFQTLNGSTVNSTTSTLFYGLKNDTGSGSQGVANSYAASEQVFRQASPASAPGYSFLTCMITSDTLADAEHLVDQGVAGDGTFPPKPVVLAKSSDTLRNVRYQEFDNAIFNTRIRGLCSLVRTNSDSPLGQTNLLGYETGVASFSISPGTFVPGAIADSMTSFGGIIFGPNGQTSLLAFINAGAAGSYGTVVEPNSNAQKFPNSQVYFYQSRGFSLAESYYQSLGLPYEGLIVCEPLAAPFAQPASGQWIGITSNAVLSGTAQLSLQFSDADSLHPLGQVDLFVDGGYFQTLTNLPPLPGNVLTLRLNGAGVTYTVPTGATLASAANDLAGLINAPAITNATGIVAFAHGDRIELHATVMSRPAPPTHFRPESLVTNPPTGRPAGFTGSSLGTAAFLSSFLVPGRKIFLASQAIPLKACSVNGTMQVGNWLQITVTKTNGTGVTVAVTNQSSTAAVSDVTGQLMALINSAPNLQGPDGVIADDFVSGVSSGAQFNLYARAAGLGPAAMTASLSGSADTTVSPATAAPLNDNLSNLQPRNHLYIVAGATNLPVTFPLDTTALADGFHELTAVAYEGSDVRTQTRVTVLVVVQNSPLSATLTPLDLTDPAPVLGTYHIQVVANTNTVSACTLFSTGGAVATITNQATATFTLDAASLGAGLHPFYAVVQSAGGLQYRTQTLWFRFIH
jgi:uncharacterized protein (TIGR03790 family)